MGLLRRTRRVADYTVSSFQDGIELQFETYSGMNGRLALTLDQARDLADRLDTLAADIRREQRAKVVHAVPLRGASIRR